MPVFSLCERPSEIPFALPPRFTTQKHRDHGTEEVEEKDKVGMEKMDTRRDILAHRGSLSVRSRSLLPFV